MSTVSFISGENKFASIDHYNQTTFSFYRRETNVVIFHPHDKHLSFTEGSKTFKVVVSVAECIKNLKSIEKNINNDEIRQILNQKITLEKNSLKEIQRQIDASQDNKNAKIKEISQILEGNFESVEVKLEALELKEQIYQDSMARCPTIKNAINKYKELENVYWEGRLSKSSLLNLKKMTENLRVPIEKELDNDVVSQHRNIRIRKFNKIIDKQAISLKRKTILQTKLNALCEEQKMKLNLLENVKSVVTSLENKIN